MTRRWRREALWRHPDTASLRHLTPPLAVSGVVDGTLLAGSVSSASAGCGWALAPLRHLAVVLD